MRGTEEALLERGSLWFRTSSVRDPRGHRGDAAGRGRSGSREGIWTGERNWGPISTISSCVIWIFYEENVFTSFRKAGVWQHVRS